METLKKILIVDDNKNFRLSLKIGLQREGFEVDDACDAIEALRTYDFNCYQVLLTDVRMPKVNGFDLAQIAIEINPSLFIILISAYDFKDFEKRYPETKEFPRLSKPFEMPDLVKLLIESPSLDILNLTYRKN